MEAAIIFSAADIITSKQTVGVGDVYNVGVHFREGQRVGARAVNKEPVFLVEIPAELNRRAVRPNHLV